jgi:hypothetical protein
MMMHGLANFKSVQLIGASQQVSATHLHFMFAVSSPCMLHALE